MQCSTHRVRRASPILGGEVPGLVLKSVPVFQEQLSRPATRTRRMTTFTTRPVSLRPSGVATSPLVPIGLALRLLEVELVFALLEKPGFRRLGIMRTMAGERGVDGGLCVPRCYQLPAQFPSFESVAVPGCPMAGWWDGRVSAFAVPCCCRCSSTAAPAPSNDSLGVLAAKQRSCSAQSAKSGVDGGFRGSKGLCNTSGTWAAVIKAGKTTGERHSQTAAVEWTPERWVYILGSVQQVGKVGNSVGRSSKGSAGHWGRGLEPCWGLFPTRKEEIHWKRTEQATSRLSLGSAHQINARRDG
jgi:hypothetical protein